MHTFIRRATAEDLASIVTLYRLDSIIGSRETPDGELTRDYRTAFSEINSDPAQYLMVAETEGCVSGTAQMTVVRHIIAQGMRSAIVEAVFVHPDYHGQGIGMLLFQRLFEIAIAEKCKRIELTSNIQRKGAHAFYEKLGFIATHTGFKKQIDYSALD